MAGLLFVFILLIGAIIVKSVVLKSSLSSTQSELEKKNKDLHSTKSLLTLKNEEIKRLKSLLLDRKTYISDLSKKLVILQTTAEDLKKKLEKKDLEIKKYKGDILILSNQLSNANSTIKLKDEQLVALLAKLKDKENKYEALVADLKTTKERIKNLTGIKIKIIGILKEALGNRVKLDKSGALRISSNILFDKDKAVLKEEAKKELEEVFTRYIMTLVVNPEIKSHLDKIIIEGHTDSDGGYLYNLNLSQARAYSVMNFLLSLKLAKDQDIKKYILASGRSYLDPIVDENGKEDKDASRRIEIKFLLKNDKAMQEIERILDDN
jgi:chemotaxis protein MotB